MVRHSISPQISEIALDVLTPTKFEEATNLGKQYFDRKNQWKVKRHLWKLLTEKIPQNEINAKPIDYALHDLGHLGSRTRDISERAAASIEHLCYFLLVEHGGKYPSHDSFGKILIDLESKNVLTSQLITLLRKFNKRILNPAKHDYEIHPEKQHLFSVPEAILILYIVTNLTKTLEQYFIRHSFTCIDPDWN